MSYFSTDDHSSRFKKRLARVARFTRLPLRLIASISWYYFKKLLGKEGTEAEKANNYYFLTLINTGTYHKKTDQGLLLFRDRDDFRFYARQSPGSDLEVFNQVWGRKEYGLATNRLKEKKNNGHLKIIDAGANVGYSTLYFLHEFPGAQVVSVEPDGDNCTMIRKNLAINNLSGQVDLKQNGVWNKTCYLQIDNSYRDGRSWSLRVTESPAPTGLLAISLLDIINEKKWDRVDLLKIDIEGSEKQVFEDDKGVRDILSRTSVLALEIHDEIADRKKIYSVLQECGFSYFDHNDLTIAYR